MTIDDLKKLGQQRFLCSVTGEPGLHAARVKELTKSGNYVNLASEESALGWVQTRNITFQEALPEIEIEVPKAAEPEAPAPVGAPPAEAPATPPAE